MDGIQRLVFDCGEPAVVGFARLEFGDFVHDILPCAGCAGRIARLQMHPRQMQAESRGVLVFVLGRDEVKGFVLVTGLEGLLLAGGVLSWQ